MITLVKVIPNAHKSRVEGFHRDALKVRINAAPDRGKANEALIELLAEYFSVSKRSIQIISGHTSRLKKVEIIGYTRSI